MINKENLPLQEPPDFYHRVLRSLEELASYFEDVCYEESNVLLPQCEEIAVFRRTLQTCALTTEQLQLLYFRELIEMQSPVYIHFFLIFNIIDDSLLFCFV